MSEFSIRIDSAEIQRLATDIHGPIARELEFFAANTVEWDVKEAIGHPAGFRTARNGFRVYDPNPPEGPPRERTGDMWKSVFHERATNAGRFGMHVNVTVRSQHYDFNYPQWLVNQGYIFIRRGTPGYTFVSR